MKKWMERMQNRMEEVTGEAAPAGSAAPAPVVTPAPAAPAPSDKKVEDAGNVTPRDPGKDELDDLTPEQLRARVKLERERASAAELRATQAQDKLTPLEQKEKERQEAAERERPIADKLKNREDELKGVKSEKDKLEARVRNGDLREQLRAVGYSTAEISDIVDLAAPEEILYDATKGEYRLDMTRFVARKPHYTEPASKKTPEPDTTPRTPAPQGTPSGSSQRARNWTDAEIAALSPEEYEKHRLEIFASRAAQKK